MALKLRPTGLGSGIDKDRPDFTIYSGEWEMGRIYETRGGAVSEELARLEGVGRVGRVALASLSPLAALPNSCRFSVNLLRGMTPFWRYR